MTLSTLDLALVEEAVRKSGLIWVRGTGVDRALWHAWVDGAAYVVGGGPGEQPLPGLADGGAVVVTVRSKDKGGRLLAWTARAEEVTPTDPRWEPAVAELKGKRLNSPDTETMTARWARECRVLRLEPFSVDTEGPTHALAAEPLPSPATTRRPAPAGLPKLLLKRRRRS
ncbi:hypothetical protein ACN20G_07500 [Streptomyces sp. BI20]|uniref:hypothetical protein n=1 Tax=Streptomyces sp. BI20 TaxID=3403460 RepID=UPI003C7490CC